MHATRRKLLPHEVPFWVDPQKEIYFITINCESRGANQLALPQVAKPVFETVKHRQQNGLWWPHLFLVMPDRVHSLVSFPLSNAQNGRDTALRCSRPRTSGRNEDARMPPSCEWLLCQWTPHVAPLLRGAVSAAR